MDIFAELNIADPHPTILDKKIQQTYPLEYAEGSAVCPIERSAFLLECAVNGRRNPIEKLTFLLEHAKVPLRSPIERSAGINVK